MAHLYVSPVTFTGSLVQKASFAICANVSGLTSEDTGELVELGDLWKVGRTAGSLLISAGVNNQPSVTYAMGMRASTPTAAWRTLWLVTKKRPPHARQR